MFRVENLLNERLQKHRDYDHDSFFEHEMDNGGWYTIDLESVKVKYEPIEESPLLPSQDYYFVDFGLHNGDTYVFLVPAEPDNSQPNRDTIRDTINETVATPVVGGRDWFNYLDLDDEDTANHPRVFGRLARGERQEAPKLARQSSFDAFWDNI